MTVLTVFRGIRKGFIARKVVSVSRKVRRRIMEKWQTTKQE
jgi:hypothetical protein